MLPKPVPPEGPPPTAAAEDEASSFGGSFHPSKDRWRLGTGAGAGAPSSGVLVFDFRPNGSLNDWLHVRRRPLSLKESLAVGTDVGLAVDYLHVQGETPIVHCDLKPSNMLLGADMNVHVGDFGLVSL